MTDMFDNTFHTIVDRQLQSFVSYPPKDPAAPRPHPTAEDTVTRQREVTYSVLPHFHPFVPQLAQRLRRSGEAGLQAADTEIGEAGRTRPGGTRLVTSSGALVTLVRGSTVTLDTTATVQNGAEALDLSIGFRLTLDEDLVLPSDRAVTAAIDDGLASVPTRGEPYTVDKNRSARLVGPIVVTSTTLTKAVLPNGTTATIPAATGLRVPAGTRIVLPAGTPTVVERALLQPLLYRDLMASDGPYRPSDRVTRPWPVADLDFSDGGAYSVYNWELFYHAPFLMALHLSKNQRFPEAEKRFRVLLDFTSPPTVGEDVARRVWRFRPFQDAATLPISEVLANLATGADEELRRTTIASIANWQENPFRPHLVARYRIQAYMAATLMAYLDHHLAWGDWLFSQDTGETVDEAAMHYVYVAQVLGPRPQAVPPKGDVRPKNYRQLKQAGLKEFSVALTEVEAGLPFDLFPVPAATPSPGLTTLRSLGQTLYFAVPPNDKLLGYWDVVADRLFKIRNSLDIHGVFRRLALFEPPLDPGMLARAAAAGLNVAAIVGGLNQPVPQVRYAVLAARASELARETASLGAAMLSAVEKQDGEALALLRHAHERGILDLVERQRYGSLVEATKTKEGLRLSLAAAVDKYVYYERQLGRDEKEIRGSLPTISELSKDERKALADMDLTVTESSGTRRRIDLHPSDDPERGFRVNTWERDEMDQLGVARTIGDVLRALKLGAQGLALVPDFHAKLAFWGIGADTHVSGGTKLGHVARFAGDVAEAEADRNRHNASNASRVSSLSRREQDWAFASNSASHEIDSIIKQLRVAQIREEMASLELATQRQHKQNAEAVAEFLNADGSNPAGKVSNQALYSWMRRELKSLHTDALNLAVDAARKAERALAIELGTDGSYIRPDYNSGKEGLLAGERLSLDLKRMDLAYLESNTREYELTSNVSLLQLAPTALARLRATGTCEVSIPESFFDLDTPGHFFRRIRSVAVTIPSLVGPYTTVACRLTLTKSEIRINPLLSDNKYERNGENDSRFSSSSAATTSIVTSSAQADPGVFELNPRDDRYLPFEFAGAISTWSLQLAADPSQDEIASFDYSTISDVIIQLRYTAREGGDNLRRAAKQAFKAGLKDGGIVRLLSLRHDFPNSWASFRSAEPDADGYYPVSVELLETHYPYWAAPHLKTLVSLTVLADLADDGSQLKARGLLKQADAERELVPGEYGKTVVCVALTPDDSLAMSRPLGKLGLRLNSNAITDLWVAVGWVGK